MDFQPQMNQTLPGGIPMPYFMAYPDYPCIRRTHEETEGEKAWQDFEYLRRTYPMAVGKLLRRVEEILDKMDYEGSMIYDEYPDRVSLQNLGDAVARILRDETAGIRREEARKGENGEEKHWEQNRDGDAYLRELAQILVCNEIYRRRRKRKQDTNGRITTGFERMFE